MFYCWWQIAAWHCPLSFLQIWGPTTDNPETSCAGSGIYGCHCSNFPPASNYEWISFNTPILLSCNNEYRYLRDFWCKGIFSCIVLFFLLFCFLKKKKCLKLESSSVLKCKDNYTNTVIVNSCMVCFSQWRGRDATTNEHPQLLSTFLDVRAWNTGDGAEGLLGFSHFFIHFCSSCSTEGLNFHCSFSSWSQFEDAVEISPHSKAGSGLVRRPNTSFQKWSWLGY